MKIYKLKFKGDTQNYQDLISCEAVNISDLDQNCAIYKCVCIDMDYLVDLEYYFRVRDFVIKYNRQQKLNELDV
jgi:hypothetical protein